ncbi:uncharacterized protein [Salmo salar]|uniref:Uncharacterized protein n=1 Tax=Salmo salar TaxID=8030 RepID=A0A1S3LMM8_SALSA|nr:uncharacterized protein LOC106567462 [Salmo salar]|eukprot:XP_013992217.1 PREDICTED: uncharacterized protein LOC106567462 [Salmo salar]
MELSQVLYTAAPGIDDWEQPSLEGVSVEQNACSQSPSHYCRPDRPQRRITDASCTLNDDIDAILPFCTNGFTLTPPGTKLHISDPNKQRTTCAQVHCAESPRPEKLLLQETALHGQDSNERCPAESGRPGEKKSRTHGFRDSSEQPASKKQRLLPGVTAQKTIHPESTQRVSARRTFPIKPDDFTVLNDIPEVDDLLLCDAANLLDSSYSYVETPNLK